MYECMYDHSKSSEVPSTPALGLVFGERHLTLSSHCCWMPRIFAGGTWAKAQASEREAQLQTQLKQDWDLWDLGLWRASCLPWSLVCRCRKGMRQYFLSFPKIQKKNKTWSKLQRFSCLYKDISYFLIFWTYICTKKHVLCNRQRCSTAWWTWQPIVVGFLSSWCLGLKLGWELGNVHRENGLNRADCIWLHESRIFLQGMRHTVSYRAVLS